jgi:hypothetical protein
MGVNLGQNLRKYLRELRIKSFYSIESIGIDFLNILSLSLMPAKYKTWYPNIWE